MSTTEIGSKIDSRLNLGDKEKICKIVLEIIRQNKRSFALLSLKVNKFSQIFWHWKKVTEIAIFWLSGKTYETKHSTEKSETKHRQKNISKLLK